MLFKLLLSGCEMTLNKVDCILRLVYQNLIQQIVYEIGVNARFGQVLPVLLLVQCSELVQLARLFIVELLLLFSFFS